MTRIPLGLDGKFYTLVDDQDAEFASRNIWSRHKGRTTYYASRLVAFNGSLKRVYLHREIMGATRGIQVDHRDGDGLNNVRENLRGATNSQNHSARMTRPGHFKSRFRGVYWHKQNRCWCAQIKHLYKKKHLGCFSDEELAARTYDDAALNLFGEFIQLNFPV